MGGDVLKPEAVKRYRGIFRLGYNDLVLIVIIIISTCYKLYPVALEGATLSEFDPWFNYGASGYLVNNGYSKFRTWFDRDSWYPYGRDVGNTMYPGMQYALLVIHWVMRKLGFEISVLESCLLEGILFGAVFVVFMYLFTKSFSRRDSSALLAALLSSCSCAHFSRASTSEYDNEIVAIPIILMVLTLWTVSLKTGKNKYIILCSLALHFLTLTWGGYIFATNAIVMHVASLMVAGRYSENLYKCYSLLYLFSTSMATTIPPVKLSALLSFESIPTAGAFGMLQLWRINNKVSEKLDKKLLLYFRLVAVTLLLTVIAAMGVLYSSNILKPLLLRVSMAFGFEQYEPMLISISEHYEVKWKDTFFNGHSVVLLSAAGIQLAFHRLRDEDILAMIVAISSHFLSSKMGRISAVSIPFMIMFSSDVICTLLHKITIIYIKVVRRLSRIFTNSRADLPQPLKLVMNRILPTILIGAILYPILSGSLWHYEAVIRNNLSEVGIITRGYDASGREFREDSFREMYSWIKYNTDRKSSIVSWWDYGYQTSAMTGRITYVDNNTNDFGHIAYIALILTSVEKKSYELMHSLGADYILVYYLGMVRRSLDDIAKSFWIATIAEHDYPDKIALVSFPNGNIDKLPEGDNKDITLHKLSLANIPKNILCAAIRCPSGFDNPLPIYFEEIYSTKNYTLRLYKVKARDPLGRSLSKCNDNTIYP